MLAGAAFAFAINVGEFDATMLLAEGVDSYTMPVALERYIGNRLIGPSLGPATAMGTLLLVVTAVSFVVIDRLGERWGRDRGRGTGVKLDGVSVRFGNVPALSEVSPSIEEREFFTLVGSSGCGKTTTLRTVAGFETPNAETVRVAGADVASVPPRTETSASSSRATRCSPT